MRMNSLGKRLLWGLALGLLLGLGLMYVLLAQTFRDEAQNTEARLGIVTLQSFVEIVQKAADEEAMRTAVTDLAKGNPSLRMIRVIKGLKLIASTDPQDVGEKAAPRRLARDEKTIFDLGQRLRAAVLTNVEEGASRKEEIDIATATSGGLVLSGPIEEEGAVVGFVQIETAPPSPPETPQLLIPIAVMVVSILLLASLAMWFAENKWALIAGAVLLLTACLAVYGHYSNSTLVSGVQKAQDKTILTIKQQAESGEKALQQFSGQQSTLSRAWDVDVFRHPRGLIAPTGESVPSELSKLKTQYTLQLHKAFLAIWVLSLAVLLFIGLGGLARVIGTIVRHREAYAYIAPAMIGMLVLVFFPFFYGIALSFTNSNLYNTDKTILDTWVGLKNYFDVLGDFSVFRHTGGGGVAPNYANFYYTFLFTIFWTVTNVTLGVTLGMILALMLNTKGLAMRPFYRVLLIFPWAMPNYITALIWKGMFHQQFGVINQVIQIFGGTAISWFEKPFTSFLTALATNGWLSFPFMMVVSLGALQSISADLYEAARVDGATRWQQFRAITLPSLKPALIPAIILSVVWTFNMFNIIFLVTQGEPAGSTEILITQAYKIAFQKYQYGYAAAYSTVIFFILLIYGSVQNKITQATEAIAGG